MKRSKQQQEIVRRAVRRTLNVLETPGGADSLAEGESYVCSWCIQPVKPCESDPHYECKDKILGETRLNGLATRLREASNGFPAVCPMCGKALGVQSMKRNVLRELCPSCCSRTKRGKMKKEDSNDT